MYPKLSHVFLALYKNLLHPIVLGFFSMLEFFYWNLFWYFFITGPPVWIQPIVIVPVPPTSANITWTKEREDIKHWVVTVKEGASVNTFTVMTTYYVLNNIQNDRVYSIEVKMVDVAGQESIPRNVNYTGITIHKKWSFLLRIFLENVTKSPGNCVNLRI